MRRLAGLLVVGLLAFGATGCTVPINGITGVGLDRDGNLVIVLAWCGRQPDGVTVYHRTYSEDSTPETYDPDASGPANPAIDDASYRAPRVAGETASFRIDAPGNGWRADQGIPSFDPDVTYRAYGWTRDNTFSTAHVEFQISDAGKLRRNPGTVLVNDYDPERDKVSDVLLPQAEFDRQGRTKYCDD
ncbi:hypothetical protein OHB01_22065 [Microbispora hainanensis]|jgi:hypothetical protein|uniref:Lipoprotein n=1 Tax=Microbispora hainanensis TaxID=568844 RepID=A0ABZ1SV04_9ACTN|nr:MULTISPECIES: hypothetical protein [Microbispora]NJP28206.1 hypothetical protein [Microbispora sp. CL1-1]TQS09381.1 hypothetical protein FLW53_29225 [Microbispora sp. SCL1-1]